METRVPGRVGSHESRNDRYSGVLHELRRHLGPFAVIKAASLGYVSVKMVREVEKNRRNGDDLWWVSRNAPGGLIILPSARPTVTAGRGKFKGPRREERYP